jgi:hypothetical protein
MSNFFELMQVENLKNSKNPNEGSDPGTEGHLITKPIRNTGAKINSTTHCSSLLFIMCDFLIKSNVPTILNVQI